MHKLFERLERFPVPVLPTLVGAITLGNFMVGLGYTLPRDISVLVSSIVIVFYIIKLIKYPAVCKKEYETVVPRSLYSGFTMILMAVGAYIFPYQPVIGKGLWLIGIILHVCHILLFTYQCVLTNFTWSTFVPSWFVTYNGIMVSTVVGTSMNEPLLGKAIVYYGITVYFILVTFLLYRLKTKPLNDALYHTQAILLAPCSLCLVSYLNFIENKNIVLVSILYFCVLASLLFIIIKLPKFFSFDFHPGFAGLTFPMAIGCVASSKMVVYLTTLEYKSLASIINQITGLQMYLTAMCVGYVLVKLTGLLFRIKKA